MGHGQLEQSLHANLVFLRGRVTSPPVVRDLASGSVLATVQVTTGGGDGPAVSVPIAWWDPGPAVEQVGEGDEIVVIGRVRRRFFRSGERTASRVEVEALAVVSAGNRRRVRTLVRRVHQIADALADGT